MSLRFRQNVLISGSLAVTSGITEATEPLIEKYALSGTGGLSEATADLSYLKLDTSNDPIIGTLEINVAGGGTQLYLNASTSNHLVWNTNGVAAPTFTTRSTGTKLILFPEITAAKVDYAIGIEGNSIWQSVPENTSARHFYWYGGTTRIMDLDGASNLTVNSGVAANSVSGVVVHATYISGNKLSYAGQDTDERYQASGVGVGGASAFIDLTDVQGVWTSGQIARHDGTNFVPYEINYFVGDTEPTATEDNRGDTIIVTSGGIDYYMISLSGTAGYGWQTLAMGDQ